MSVPLICGESNTILKSKHAHFNEEMNLKEWIYQNPIKPQQSNSVQEAQQVTYKFIHEK